MKKFFEIFTCRKSAVIKELNGSLEKANAKIAALETSIEEYKRVNERLGSSLKASERERMKAASEAKAATEVKNRVWEKLETLRKEYKELEKKVQKRGKNGRFIKKNKE